jgi:transposase
MIGTQKRWQEDLFVAGPLSSLIPEDHILKQVDKVLDLFWLRCYIKDLYCTNNGRPSIDPESALRLMLAGFFQGVGPAPCSGSVFYGKRCTNHPYLAY